MDSNDVASSPGSLSSPPHSPEQSNGRNSSTIRRSSNNGVAANPSTPTPASASATSTPRLTAAGTVRKKPGPKPKLKDPNVVEEKKSRKPRKPVEPKDPATAPPARKRRTKASLDAQPAPQTPPVEERPIVQQQQQQQQTAPTPTPTPTPAPVAAQQTRPAEQAPVLKTEHVPVVTQAPRVLSNPEPQPQLLHHNPNLSHINVTPSTPSPRPASSGQRYDPIRGGLYESKPHAAASIPPPPTSPPLNRASASPSITSLIDPPSASNSTYPQVARLQHRVSVTSAPVSPVAMASRPASVLPHHDQPQPQPQVIRTAAPVISTPMEIDTEMSPKVSVPMKKSVSASGATPPSAPTPPVKPARQKEAPPPLPSGSGLLSGTPFGPAANTNGSTDPQGVNIWLSFPLKGQTNITINFAQEVEKKYGFAALHPRIAARKERQRQITAAGAALEKAAGMGSADDMSLDLSEAESNVEMGGMNDDGSAGGNAVKRRKRKQEDYDKEDDFIDDTELAWEQQALMAKDGFFVYSGPLIPENEKPAVERADGTVRRGRGRGRGGTVRGEASARGRGRGGGPGSRGGTTVRKPRVTKADRAMMEAEKHEREKMAVTMAAKQAQPVPTFPPTAMT